ncbi:MAG: NtrC family signal transduction histidine kinase [candidate division TA06 bacterium 32_111]|uniref:histidine kinase n=2 Tax=Bacteria candidate phyla TaxID=1783234 RepID=A0A117M6U3_UNCT6|nr:MAG: NtrC family signal transduction histidine kinase [candidate division TA06 bacterium 32_111]KUK87596.1 MAG: NtrC family signal transduction histidine kinase [candidate division TA06 bacterium 34_109]HAF07435.1 hypothetical protein [candidate division WOR-3 bacterium]HCP17504.1 hypothetical protein [candidate division WOR-3 bacterium]
MKEKTVLNIKNFQTILLFLIFLILIFFQTFEFVSKNRTLDKEFLTRSRIITNIIGETYKNVSSNIVSIEEFIFNEMFFELERNKEKYRYKGNFNKFLENDLFTEGFSFSENYNRDSFVIFEKEQKDLYRISRSKNTFKTILKDGGLKNYLDDLSALPEIEYILFQDNLGIFYASFNVSQMKSIFFDSLLMYSFFERVDTFRIQEFEGKKVFEIISPVKDENLLLRVGFVIEEMNRLKRGNLINFLTYLFFTLSLYILLITILSFYAKNIRLSQKLLEESGEKFKIISLLDEFIFVKNIDSKEFESFDKRFERKFNFSLFEIEEIKDIVENLKEVKDFQIFYKNYKFLVSSTRTSDNKKLVLYLKDITEFENLKEEKRRMEFQSRLGEMTFRISHELKNPLNGISIILQRMMRKNVLEGDEKVMLKEAFDEVERMNKRIVEFTRFSKPYQYRFEKVSLNEIFEEIVSSLKILLDERKIEIKLFSECDRFLFGDRQMLSIAFKNIVLNAIEASTEGKKVEIKVDSFEGKILIEIVDHGEGMEYEEKEKIFDLFYTTKENGSGIGLATAKRIIEDHKGKIEVESKKGVGTTIKIFMEEMKDD